MNVSEKAKQLYQRAIVIDGQLGFEAAMPVSLASKWQLVDRYKATGVTAVTLSLANDESTLEQTMTYIAAIRKHIAANREHYILATSSEDIVKAKQQNKIALRLMFQGTAPIGKDLNLVDVYRALGISSMVLAYNIRTPIGDGVVEEQDAGLSHLGKKFVMEMNRAGLIMDGSHASYLTAKEAMALSCLPVIFSHSAVHALNPHIRNLKDDQIQAVAQSGGVIGINGLGLLLGDADASLEKYVDHIDYIVKLVGISHVAIGLDNLYFADQFAEFMQNQPITHPQAYANRVSAAIQWQCVQPEQLVEIVEILLTRGYAEADILAILGGNILRVMQAHDRRKCYDN